MNMGIFVVILFGRFLQQIFFGQLRILEVEHLYERSWYAVTETCLAMTIFRDEFDAQFVFTFTALLFLKIFHWLCQDRVEFMEQSPAVPRSFHVRMVTLMATLALVDIAIVHYSIETSMRIGPTVLIMFAFEYSILAAMAISTFAKYVLNVIDMRMEDPWENKSMYVFYLDLMTDFFKLITYLIFFVIILTFYGLPLHIIRDVYVTLRSFLAKCRDLVRYRRATRNMNERYPDGTNDELERLSDRTCIICREEMVASDVRARRDVPERRSGVNDTPKKLPCGHIFHFHCLRSWLERQQSCPTCRRPVLEEQRRAAPQPNAGGALAPPQAGQVPQPFNGAAPNHPNHHQPGGGYQGGYQPGGAYQGGYPPMFFPPAPQIINNDQPPPPGLIPLFPTAGANGRLELPELTEEQLNLLGQSTREGIQERIRVLNEVQRVSFEAATMLSQVWSVLPQGSNVTTAGVSEEASTSRSETSAPAPAPTRTTSTAGPLPTPPSISQDKGKRPDTEPTSSTDDAPTQDSSST